MAGYAVATFTGASHPLIEYDAAHVVITRHVGRPGHASVTVVVQGSVPLEQAVTYDAQQVSMSKLKRWTPGSTEPEPSFTWTLPGMTSAVRQKLAEQGIDSIGKLDRQKAIDIWRWTRGKSGLFPQMCDVMRIARMQFSDMTLSQLQLRTVDDWLPFIRERPWRPTPHEEMAAVLVENDIIGVRLFTLIDEPTLQFLPGVGRDRLGEFEVMKIEVMKSGLRRTYP
jgi:hypothetical protein